MAQHARFWHGGCARLLPVLALAFATSAQAGGLSFVEYDLGTPPTDGLREPEELAVSPDGLNLYTASYMEDSIGVFTRNPSNGALTFLEVQEDGVGGVDGLRDASGVAVSPDGNCVYGTGERDDAVAVFARNPLTGALLYVEKQNADGPQTVAVSPDDQHVYVLGSGLGGSTGAVRVFSRTPPGCALIFVEEETGDAAGLGKEAEAMAITADGAHVYVGGSFDDGTTTQGAVNVLSRNAVTGQLTFVEREYNGAGGVERLARVSGLAVSPDGAVVIVEGANAAVVVGPPGHHPPAGKVSMISRSVASGNDERGIYVSGDAATIKGNKADGNGFPGGASDLAGLGILAEDYTTAPAGSNTARGNDDPAECSPASLC